MGYMKEKVAYLKGLAEGMEIGGDPQGKLIRLMIDTMDEMAAALDENELAMEELDECIDDIYDELDSIEEFIFEEDDEEAVSYTHLDQNVYPPPAEQGSDP